MRVTALLLACTLVLGPAAAARAEGYFGVYGGYSFVEKVDIESASDVTIVKNADFDDSPLVGGKLGYWDKCLPWLATELNAWSVWTGPKGGGDLTLVNVSASALLQLPLGPLRPYGGAGVLGAWARLSDGGSETDWAVGYLGQAGLELKLAPGLALFGEYRRVWSSLDFKRSDRQFDVDRNELLGGLTLHY